MDHVSPYCGPAPIPETLLSTWNLDPPLLAILALSGLLGLAALHRVSGPEPARRPAFAVAMAALILAFVSPLCALSVALFSARTVHHLVLLGLAAPALAMAFPMRLLPIKAAWVALSAALLGWHIPTVYTAAWDSALVYWLLQGALLLPAWAFWSAILARNGHPLAPLTNAGLIAGLVGQMGFLGAILTFAPHPLYGEHLIGTDAFGLGLLADQQLAGLIMWVPGMLPLAIAAALVLRRGWRQESAA